MEDFYRWQRTRLDILMDDGAPAGGRWNHDTDNREPPPTDGRPWPAITRFRPRRHRPRRSRATPRMLGCSTGAGPGRSPDSRRFSGSRSSSRPGSNPSAPTRTPCSPTNGSSLTRRSARRSTSACSTPGEVIEAAEAAYRAGAAPINSVEGFIRQVLGWREYVWGMYWLDMPEYRSQQPPRRPPPAPAGVHR